jgi:hypothetical protein
MASLDVIGIIVRYALISSGMAAAMYLLARLQLAVMDRLIKVDIPGHTRRKISVWTAIATFFLTLALVFAQEWSQ